MKVVKKSTKEPKKYAVGGAIQAAIGLGSAIYGGVQARRGRKALERLNAERPTIEVPSAFRRLAAEPIAEAFIRARREGVERRTGQALDEASRLGTRGVLGTLSSVINAEQQAEQQMFGEMDHARQQALGVLGNAELDVQNRENQRWLQQVAGAQSEMAAGNQNIFGGLSSLGLGLGTVFNPKLGGIDLKTLFKKQQGEPLSVEEINAMQVPQGGFSVTPRYGTPSKGFEQGGMMTEGEFSHKKNPISLVNKEGEVIGEATGNEVILNPEQRKKIAEQSPYAKRLFNKFMKEAKKK